MQTDWTVGPEVAANPYHVLAIRGSLTRNLVRCFPQVRDEIVNAFDEVLALKDNGAWIADFHYNTTAIIIRNAEWKLVGVVPTTMQVVARTSNRLFVGLPLCAWMTVLSSTPHWKSCSGRVQEYLDLNVTYTISIFARGQLIALFPEFLKPFVFSVSHSLYWLLGDVQHRQSAYLVAQKFRSPCFEIPRTYDWRAPGEGEGAWTGLAG
jgi:hypothetical protein